jgi:hypothetical protein
MIPGGGANSGIPKAMLSAGEGTDATKAKWIRYKTDNSKPLDQYAQNDINGSIIARSKDPEAWTKQGHLLFRTCNDGDLVEPMIGYGIQVMLNKRFWQFSTCRASDGRPLIGPYKATILDVVLKENLPPQVKVLVDVPNQKPNGKHSHYITEVLISQDPTVDGTKPMHKNCLREAIMDTYPRARDDPNYTIQDLINDAIEKELYEGPEAPAATEENANDSPGPSTSKEPASKGRQPTTNKNKNKRGRKATEEEDDGEPKKAKLDNYSTKYAFKAGVRSLVETTRAFFGVSKSQPFYRPDDHEHGAFRMRNDTPGAAYAAFFATVQVCAMASAYGYSPAFLPLEPKNQRDARKRPDAAVWRCAENKELDMLFGRDTFEMTDRPANYDPLPLQFVYKLKVTNGDYENGVPKARLVAMGNLQYDDEYGDTYAPTARLWTVRALAAIAAQEGLTMKKFDLTGAFLIADMDKPIYVQIPGYDLPKDKAILLKKALYGTKNAGALYSKEIKKWLTEYGFKATTVDETLFRLTRVKNGKTSTLLISLYVDDGACCTNDEELYQEFLTALQEKYELSDSGDLTWHLGINVTQDLQAGTIAFDQTAYIESVLKRFNMEGCKDKYTPLPPRTYLTSEDSPKTPNKRDVKTYQQLMGSLMYVACGTRPDIAFAVNSCAQFMQNPGPSHFEAAKHILRYLKTTKAAKLTYSKQPPQMANVLYGYVDADHAGSTEDRKSVGGYVLMLNGGAISWASRKIKVVSLSSFESEWYSASICGCEVVVMRRLLEEIGREQTEPTVIFEDNAACIYTAMHDKKPFGRRSKHIDTRVFKLREFVEEKVLELHKVDTLDNVADCLTKALSREQVERARDYMFGTKT